MPRLACFLAFACLALSVLACTPAFASLATVPGTHSTIQSAIDSGVDTVFVGDGVYEERLRLRDNLCVVPVVTVHNDQTFEAGPLVRGIANVDLQASDQGNLMVRGMRFLGAVDLFCNSTRLQEVAFERCRFDSAFVGPHSGSTGLQLTVRSCMIFGSLNLEVGYLQFTGNAVIGGGLEYWGDGNGIVRNNDFSGPGPFGLRLAWTDNSAIIEWNTVHGFENGIEFAGTHYEVRNNRITDCARDGIVLQPDFGGTRNLEGNTVLRCGRYGVYAPACSGYECNYPSLVSNTIGHCGADGVRLASYTYSVRRNTVFANQGAGIVIEGATAPDSLTNNICAFNTGPGLAWSAGAPPAVMGCNDWFGNGGGAVTGLAPAPTDVQLDPQFCAMAQDDVRLAGSSPLLALAGCGLVGAKGQGCSVVLGVAPVSESSTFAIRVSPTPGRGVVRFAVPPMPEGGRLEVFDVTGARRWGVDVAAGVSSVEWRGTSDGGAPAAAGVYFARLTSATGASASARVLLAK